MPAGDLAKIDHFVVLMLENRSFDHFLGYLSHPDGRGRDDVDGLTDATAVRHGDRLVEPFHLGDTYFRPGPKHDFEAVREQLATEDGYLVNFAKVVKGDPRPIMGFYTQDELPLLDHLADQFCVCDRWFCSFPGDTWVNRVFSLCGTSHRLHQGIPLFDGESFVRQLDGVVDWRWYRHDPVVSGLRLVDGHYRVGHGEHFRRIDRLEGDLGAADFPSVTWIEPAFRALDGMLPGPPNDDHPPCDIRHGQQLIRRVYGALRASRHFAKMALIVLYDEHGGFYDHVPPPAAPGERPEFRRLGPRVPAIVCSPWVRRGSVSSTVFDHTSIIRTLLERFRPDAIARMPERVQRANHLGDLFGEAAARTDFGALPDAPPVDAAAAAAGGAEAETALQREVRLAADALRALGAADA